MATPSRFCEPADLHDHGLPRGALPNPGRLVAEVSAASDTLTLDEHGFADDTEVLVRAEAGGSLPSPLVAGTPYYVIAVTDATFQLAAAEGGAAIDLTTAGENVFVVAPLPVDAAIRWASAIVESFAAAHVIEQVDGVYHEAIVAITAELAIAKLLSYTGQAPGTLNEAILGAQKLLERLQRVPLRGPNTPPAANLAVTGTVAGTDPRGWTPCGGGLP